MRVSTFQFYNTPADNIGRRASELNAQIPYMSEGKRILTAKDDPLAAGTLAGFKEQLAKLDQYEKNINMAKGRNELLESNLTGATTALQRMHALFIQAQNGSLSSEALDAVAIEMQGIQEELLGVANQKDEIGNYLFGGFAVSSPPFTLDPNGQVQYNGDYGVRDVIAGNNLRVGITLSGFDVFQAAPNAIGDFKPNYLTNAGGFEVNTARIVDKSAHDTTISTPYTLTFNDTTGDGVADEAVVTDGLGNVLPSTPAAPGFTPGSPISVNGVEIVVDGQPAPGDQVELEPHKYESVFDTVQKVIDWTLNKGSGDPTQELVDYNELLTQLNGAIDHVASNRSELGSRMQVLERQLEQNQDYNLTINESKSKIEDLDYAKAVTEFEKSRLTLQAAQQAFGQMKNISLFNYI